MGLSLKTEEADRLARELSRLTGETMTKAMRERLERLRAAGGE
ncbi:type II toxin-antitoxin system VapB family antitoxin [Sinorhizobium medicae]|nr:type II toxin-antitoxin system VapB family antitoxin [Sinorhizobium medicae]